MRHYMTDPDNEERLLKIPPRVVAEIKAEAYIAVRTHDPLCYRSHDQPLGRDPFCQCAVVAKAREDERSDNFTPDDFSDAMTEAYQRGLNDALEAVELIPAPYKMVGNFETYGPYHEGRSDMKDMVLSAIDALREDSETPPPLPPSVGVPERKWS